MTQRSVRCDSSTDSIAIWARRPASKVGQPVASPRRAATKLGDLMRRSVVTVRPDDRLEYAARLMLEREVSGLPVVDGSEVVGLITESDVFEAFTRMMEGLRTASTRPAQRTGGKAV